MGCCSQFDLLVELFQDEEKATSPTGQAPGTGGRTRLSVKPDKSRDKGSKEHKKTVGCQVLQGVFCFPLCEQMNSCECKKMKFLNHTFRMFKMK